MNLYALDDEVVALDSALPALQGMARLHAEITLAWYLRQRDSQRALLLADTAAHTLRNSAVEGRALLDARLDLVRAEIAALQGDYPQAERLCQQAIQVCMGSADLITRGDAAMVEAVVAHAQAQSSRYMTAWQHAADCYRQAGDALREQLATAWPCFLGAHADRTSATATLAGLRATLSEPHHPALDALLCATEGMLRYAEDVAISSVHAHKASLYARDAGLIRHAIVSAVNAGVAMQNLSDFEGAAQCYDWAVNRARQTGWLPLIGATLMRLGGLLRELGQLERSETLFREALVAMASVPGGVSKAEAHAGLGNTLLRQGRAAEAASLFQTAVALYRAELSIDGLSINLNSLARAQARCGDIAAARAAMAEASTLIREHGIRRLEVDLNEAWAELYSHAAQLPDEPLDAPTARLHYLEAALRCGRNLDGWTATPRLLLELGRAWTEAGDASRGFAYAEEAMAAQQREASRKAADIASLMQARNDIERDRAEMAHQREMIASMQEHTRILDRLGLIGQAITHHRDLASVFATLDTHLQELLDMDSMRVYLLDTSGTRLDGVIAMEAGQTLPAHSVALDHPDAHSARCARERVEICLHLDAETTANGRIPGTLPTRSLLYGPLIVHDRLLGVLTIQSLRAHAYDERAQMIFRSLCAYGAIALDNAQAYRQLESARQQLEDASLTDPLTGLRNRRFLAQHLDIDIAQCLRHHAQSNEPGEADLVFFLVDLDHFKQVNDTHGHAAGDAILMQMRDRLREVFRDSDYLIRWGGEEFLVVARGIARQQAPELAERIRCAVADRAFRLDDGSALVKTCSLGFAAFPFIPAQAEAVCWQEVVDLADQALYVAKHGGRNAWVGVAAGPASASEFDPGLLKSGLLPAQAKGMVECLHAGGCTPAS